MFVTVKVIIIQEMTNSMSMDKYTPQSAFEVSTKYFRKNLKITTTFNTKSKKKHKELIMKEASYL